MPKQIRKPAYRLVPGDVLVSKIKGRWQERARVLSTPRTSQHAPKDKVEIILWLSGAVEPTVRYWDRMMMVTVSYSEKPAGES